MQLARILLVLAALTVIGTEVTSFRFPSQIPTSFSSWLPFTFNVTKDYTNLGSVTLNIKPKLRRQAQTAKIKRDVPTGLPIGLLAEKDGRLNSKDSRLFSPLTERWEFGIPSGASLTAGSMASLAGLMWTIISKNLKYKKEHGELGPMGPPPSPHGLYNAPSYGSDYSLPPHQKLEKGFSSFFKGSKGIKEMQAQAMKGFTRLFGLRDLNNLLHPGQRPKKLKLKLKKRPVQQQQYYEQPVYQSSYTPQVYPNQQSYDPSYAYAPPPEATAYAPPPPLPEYVPAPIYEPAPEPAPVYVLAPELAPAPAYATAPGPAPAYAAALEPPPPYAADPQPAPVYVPEQAPIYARAPETAPVYVPPPVDVPTQVNVVGPPLNEPPAQYSPTNDFPNTAAIFAPPSRGIPPQAIDQPWNDSPAPQPDVSSLELQGPKSDPASVPVAVFHSLPTLAPSTFISNGFLPIFPSPVDPLPFMPSSTHEETAQWPKPDDDVPSFGVPPSLSLSSPPPRSSRLEHSESTDPTLLVMEMSNSQISEPFDDKEDDESTQFEAEESFLPAGQWATPASSISESTTSM